MLHKTSYRGFTWIELIAILVVISLLLCLLIPAIQAAREHSRKQTCINNLRQVGVGMFDHQNSWKRFPNSAEVVGTSPATVGGCSFLFQLAPFLGYNQETRALSPDRYATAKLDPFTNSDPAFIKLKNLQIPLFICPSNPNKTYEDPVNKKIAFTNYKSMCATCMESLLLCVDPDSPPPYGDKTKHPDGGLIPGNTRIYFGSITDGMSHTIMLAETIDDSKSAWIAGSDVNLVGMPMTTYEKSENNFWAPQGFVENYSPYSPDTLPAIRTYAAFDFRPGHADAGTYPSGIGRTPAYGPSSGHPDIINHLFFDGSVKSIRTDVRYSAYFFAINRDNNDPADPTF